jgi:hypothetical protein
MKYDDAGWHTGGTFPSDLPDESAATHIGMFAAWAWLRGLGNPEFLDESGEILASLTDRNDTPGAIFLGECDGKLTDEDLNDAGNSFAATYYMDDAGGYLVDYEECLAKDLPSVYHVEDAWQNYDRLSPLLDRQFSEWKKTHTSN